MSSNNKKLQKATTNGQKLVMKQQPKVAAMSRPLKKDIPYRNLGVESKVIVNNTAIWDQFVVRREKVMDVVGTANFAVAADFYLNPGNTRLFPIFSQIASTYEEWEGSIDFEYVTDAYTSIGSTASAGKVILVTNYDPDDVTFASSTQAENYSGSVKTVPYVGCRHSVRGKNGRVGGYPLGDYFVNPSNNASTPTGISTSKFYNQGRFQLITDKNAVTTNIGELYVIYRFRLGRPKQLSATETPYMARYTLTPLTNKPLGTTPLLSSVVGQLLLTTPTGGGAQSITFNTAGRYLLVYHANSSVEVSGGPALWTLSGVSSVYAFSQIVGVSPTVSNEFYSEVAVNVGVSFCHTLMVDATVGGSVVADTAGFTLVGTATGDLYIIKVPPLFGTHFGPNIVPDDSGGDLDIKCLDSKLDRLIRLMDGPASDVESQFENIQPELSKSVSNDLRTLLGRLTTNK